MGLGDAISRIVIDVKAETKDARTKLHELNGALDAMGKFATYAREAMNDYAEHARLSATSAGININKLSQAFQGLINEHDLLTFASRTQNGAFKLNQAEMIKVGQAAIALRNRGFDLREAFDKLTNAMVKGKAEGLDDFGLSIGNADTKAGRLKNIMGELDKVIKDSSSSTGEYADDVARLGVEWDNTAAAAKRYTVELLKGLSVNEMQAKMHKQLLLESEGGLGNFFREIEKGESKISRLKTMQNFDKGFAKGKQNILDRDKLDPDKQAAADKKAAEAAKKYAEEMAKLAQALLGVESASDRAIRIGEVLRAQQQAQSDLVAQLESDYSLDGFKKYVLEMEQMNELLDSGAISWGAYGKARQKAWEEAGYKGPASSTPGVPGIDYAGTQENLKQAKEEIERMLAEMRQKSEDKALGLMKRRQDALFGAHVVFGDVEEWDLQVAAFERVGAAASAFGEAVGASYEAIVTGQGSVSAAFKKVFADGLMAMGKSSVIEALRETALGFGSLALGPIGGISAAMHFKAAALHGAVAIAAGAAAHGLGTSAQVAANEKATAEKAKEEEKAKKEQEKRAGKSGGGDGSSTDRPIYVLIGDSFSDDSIRARQGKAQAAVERALRERDN